MTIGAMISAGFSLTAWSAKAADANHPSANTITSRYLGVLLCLCLNLICSPLHASRSGLAHDLSVVLTPSLHTISVDDAVAVDRPTTHFDFVLNAGLTLTSASGTLRRLGVSEDGLLAHYRVTLPTPGQTLKLHYHGIPVFSATPRLGEMPQGLISEQGVYLDGASAWYPRFAQAVDAMRLKVQVPEDWQTISIGGRSQEAGSVVWTTRQPHAELYLIAGPFKRYTKPYGDDRITLSVWLLREDAALAARYLGLMGDYLAHYERLIGSYPYAKFAVVENRWQTGFGMPSFTLLGSRVLRLPFIPYTSLPHEILHNWWGNGVWVDYTAGNWSEGLTAYLADHWMQARQGKGDQYRLKALQRYSNFAAQGQDMPLSDFVSRHNDATQSIGYSKSLMLFHMLRQYLGDPAFAAGLRRLWQTHCFERIGFAETLRTIGASAPELVQRLLAWLKREGAPRLSLVDSRLRPLDDGWSLHLSLRQTQPELFDFDLPILITLQGEDQARREVARISARDTALQYRFEQRPLRIDIDPEYDVLRYLDPTEQPPALNRLFGGRQTWLVIPTAATPEMRAAWNRLAIAWQHRYPGLRPIEDSLARQIPAGADRILLGWENSLLDKSRVLFRRDDQTLSDHSARILDQHYAADQASVVLVSNDAQGTTTGFIGAVAPSAIPVLARKLTHYGSYGRLLFDQDGNNLLRDSLTSDHSRLSRQLSGQRTALQPPERRPLGADLARPNKPLSASDCRN